MGPIVPRNVVIRHRARMCPWTSPADIVDMWPLTYSFSDVTGISAALEIGTDTFSDDALALIDDTGQPTNTDQLNGLDEQFIGDFYAWRQTQFDRSFAGIVSPKPNGLIDTIEWDFGSGDETCRTRIFTTPHDFAFRDLGHQVPDPDSNCPDGGGPGQVATETPCVSMYGPPAPGGGGTVFDKWRVCVEDGRLREYYDGKDTCQGTCYNIVIDTRWCNNCVAPGTITINIYAGACPATGSPVATATADNTGRAGFSLPAGTYCVTASTDFGSSVYYNVPTTFISPGTNGTLYVDCVLCPDTIGLVDNNLGVTCNLHPYGTMPNGATATPGAYMGTVDYSFGATPCCPAVTVPLVYGFACGAELCGIYGMFLEYPVNYATDGVSEWACPSSSWPGTAIGQNFELCLSATETHPCYPFSASWPPGDATPCSEPFGSLPPCSQAGYELLLGGYGLFTPIGGGSHCENWGMFPQDPPEVVNIPPPPAPPAQAITLNQV